MGFLDKTEEDGFDNEACGSEESCEPEVAPDDEGDGHSQKDTFFSSDPGGEVEALANDTPVEPVAQEETIRGEEKKDVRTPQEIMDELLENAFLQAWKTSAKRAELPMLTSNFFRVHMVAQVPRGQSLDVKKSSHKKLSKFLAKMQEIGIIQVKELQKGVESIIQVNLEHEKLQHFRVVKKAVEDERENVTDVLPCDRPYQPAQITELFLVSGGAVLGLFQALGMKKNDALTAQQLREKTREYVRLNALQRGPKVQLDPLLAAVVLNKGENDLSEMSWDQLSSRLQAKMNPACRILLDGQEITKKGRPEPIEIATASRTGNKKVTLVRGLEAFGIDPSEFAQRCKVGVAASTSVMSAANTKKYITEVLVQGPQATFVSKLLLNEYRISRKYIRGLEEGGGKKKQKQ